MNSKLESEVLKLNSNWTPIGVITARKAFEDASAGAVTFLKFHEGFPTPYRLEDWLLIDAADGEDFVTTSRMHGLKKIAIPRVVICVHFNRIISKEQHCTPDALYKHYKGRDAVTGKKLRRKHFSREHVDPRSKGGKNGWENEVPMHRRLNSRRGDRPYEELGLRKPTILPAPKPLMPIHSIVNRSGFPEWKLFHIPDA